MCVENNLDWTHFLFCHRRGIKTFKLLYKKGSREIFFYEARILFPLPFTRRYIVLRNYEKELGRYRNLYHDLKSGLNTYLDARVINNGESVSMLSDYLYELPDYWRPFKKIFFAIFKSRMRVLAEEDNEMFLARMKNGFWENPACAPLVPQEFDLFTECFTPDKLQGAPDFIDHSCEYFEGEKKVEVDPLFV